MPQKYTALWQLDFRWSNTYLRLGQNLSSEGPTQKFFGVGEPGTDMI
jgi:hypothetical protein